MTHDKKKSKEEQETSPEQIMLSRQGYEDLLKRLVELESLKDRWVRSAADFENAKKRLTRERDEFVKFSQENLIRDILPVLDNFERALAHAGEGRPATEPSAGRPATEPSAGREANLEGIVSGVERVRKQLAEILKNQGLKRLQTVGEKFDPHVHEAVGFVHEPGPEDIIVEEVEPGYKLHDRLLRAAKVRVRVTSGQTPSEEKQEEIT